MLAFFVPDEDVAELDDPVEPDEPDDGDPEEDEPELDVLEVDPAEPDESEPELEDPAVVSDFVLLAPPSDGAERESVR